jgi:hypothetical protein
MNKDLPYMKTRYFGGEKLRHRRHKEPKDLPGQILLKFVGEEGSENPSSTSDDDPEDLDTSPESIS